MDTQVVTKDTRRCRRNTYRAAHKYSIEMQVGTAETEYLIDFIPENTYYTRGSL